MVSLVGVVTAVASAITGAVVSVVVLSVVVSSVVVVLSLVVEESLSLLLPQEMTVRLKRKIKIICRILFIITLPH